jgi:hypothetical protein
MAQKKQTDGKQFNDGKPGPGRPKGVPNKTTTALKEAILAAATQHGEDDQGKDGLVGYLRKVAREDVKAFSGLLGRVLPLTVAGDNDNALNINVTIGGQ